MDHSMFCTGLFVSGPGRMGDHRRQVGDLNKDQVDDVAMIVRFIGDVASPPRSLIVAFKTADGYAEPYRADGVILGEHEGGTMGDPLEPMQIRRGTIVLSFSGGSRERWGYTYISGTRKGTFPAHRSHALRRRPY